MPYKNDVNLYWALYKLYSEPSKEIYSCILMYEWTMNEIRTRYLRTQYVTWMKHNWQWEGGKSLNNIINNSIKYYITTIYKTFMTHIDIIWYSCFLQDRLRYQKPNQLWLKVSPITIINFWVSFEYIHLQSFGLRTG